MLAARDISRVTLSRRGYAAAKPNLRVRLPLFTLLLWRSPETGGSPQRSSVSQRPPRPPISKRGLLNRAAGVAPLLLLVGAVAAGVPAPDNPVVPAKQTTPSRMHGKKAVMHVYSYPPQTREITSVTSHFFQDVDACERAVGSALRSAASHASDGDLVDAQCVVVDSPDALAQPNAAPRSAEVTKL